jgi:hypothetical protein
MAPAAPRLCLVFVSNCVLGLALAADSPAGFETPPDLSPSALLPASVVSGTDYHIADPVRSDGLMHRYVVDSKFGQFDAYGHLALAVRIHEVAALTELAKTSTIEVAVGGVSRGVESQVDTAVGVVEHPVKTVTGIPRGIAHLFHGVVDEGKEVTASATSSSSSSSGGNGSSSGTAAKSETAVKTYANKYLGMTGAERHWYEKLGVDPYTNNAVLRKTVHKVAKVDAAAGFGLHFVGIPSIPGIGDIHEVMEAVYKEDPATLRARNKATLASYGLSPAEIERWQNTLVLSPTRQVLFLKAAASLDGVEGRGELFRHAMGLTSDAEAQVYLQSIGLLVLAHHKQPIAAILPGVRLPAGRRADGHIVVCGAFEAVYWTADVAKYEKEAGEALGQTGAGARQLWLEGTISDRARAELKTRGWDVQEVSPDPIPPTASR